MGPAAAAAVGPAAAPPARRGLLALALGLLVAIVVVEVLAGSALRPAREANDQAQVLAIPGVAHMVRGAQLDPTELAQVATGQRRPTPLALPAQALIDGLLLVSAAAIALPQLLSRGGVRRRSRLGSFVSSLAILLGGVAVVVTAIARLRFLVALYLSPPYGTLSYLLLYDSFRRGDSLVLLTVLMALKLGACLAFFRALPRATGERGMAGLALSSIAATVLVTFGYSLAPTSLDNIADALVASVVALVAIGWAGVIVSGSVRRLA